MQSEKRNMERMEEVVVDANEQSLQHFISNSNWNTGEVIEQVDKEADGLIGDEKDACLIVDDSGIPKKGKKSVGVARQYCGELGKVENCQVGVYAALCKGVLSTLIDMRLYLPKEWTDDKKRCLKAGVPEEAIEYRDKMELALDLVLTARERGIRYGWIGLDGFYGQNMLLLQHLDEMGEIFLAEVKKNQQIFLEDPRPVFVWEEGKKGKKIQKVTLQTNPIRVDLWAKQQPKEAWERLKIRDSTKGELIADFLHRRVWVWDGKSHYAICVHLIIRCEVGDPKEIRYGLSNAPADMPLARLGFMQAQRYWVEKNFKDAKNEVGLNEYQVRGWKGWHHHMALVMMAMLFMLEERLLNKEDYPLLSCPDIQILLSKFLPQKNLTVDEVVDQMEKRHKKRQSAINSAYRRQKNE